MLLLERPEPGCPGESPYAVNVAEAGWKEGAEMSVTCLQTITSYVVVFTRATTIQEEKGT